MTPELPQPFNQEDIRQDPKAVVIGLLIGLLLICLSAIGFLFYRVEQKNEKIAHIYQQVMDERSKKAEYYEKLILSELKVKQMQRDSSRVKEKTEPLVKKILE